MKYFFTISFFLWTILSISELKSQCTPPSADNCDQANLICSLSELNGYCCKNPDFSNPTGCTPLCPTGGATHNTGWWAFVTGGGPVSIEIKTNNCSVNGTGVQFGIWADCSCTESIVCNPDCLGPGNYTLPLNLTACKTYYLFVDGCSGDVCDFCLQIQGGSSPTIPQIDSIMGPDVLCAGACNTLYQAKLSSPCSPYFNWTLNGSKLSFIDAEINLDHLPPGNFILCAIANLATQSLKSICESSVPYCKKITVEEIEVRKGEYRFICNQFPYVWHGQIIDTPGIYSKRFITKPNCCILDSIVEFDIFNQAPDSQVYHISCGPDDPFIDPRTKTSYNQCSKNRWISLGIKSQVLPCDSGYRLNMAKIDYDVQFFKVFQNCKLQLIAKVDDFHPSCDTIQFKKNTKAKWFIKSDSLKTEIATGDTLKIDKSEDYCYEIEVESNLGSVYKICTFEYCENFDESLFFPFEICPVGPSHFEKGKKSVYFANNYSTLPNRDHQWRTVGGRMRLLSSSRDTSSVEIIWDDSTNLAWVCYSYSTDCGDSKECCIPVQLVNHVSALSKKNNSWSVYPNPAQHCIQLVNHDGILPTRIEFYNSAGIQSLSIPSPKSSMIDLQMLPGGVYYVKIFNQNEFQVIEFLLHN